MMPPVERVAYRAVMGSNAARGRLGGFAARGRLGGYGDALLACAVAAAQIAGTWAAGRHQDGVRSLDALGYALLIAGPAFLMARRRHPVLVLGGTLATTYAYLLLDYPGGPIWPALIIAFGTAVLAGHRRAAYGSLVIGFVASTWVVDRVRHEAGPSLAGALGLAAWLLVLAAICELIRYRGQLREASRREEDEARRLQHEAIRRRASEERLDIARELHDVLAHNISLINVQAGVALELMDDPEQVRASLATIKQASRDALSEVQAVLGALRLDGEQAARMPAPSIANLDRLVSGAQAAGLDVQVRVDGAPRPLPIGTDLAAYRILQESLTNVVRHAAASTVTISLAYGTGELTVQVDDDGRNGGCARDGGRPRDGGRTGGNGLTGMRERAAALGGQFEAGPTLSGGFRVRACLPVSREPA